MQGRARDLALCLLAWDGERLLQVPAEDTFRGCTRLQCTSLLPDVEPAAWALQHASWYFKRLQVVKLHHVSRPEPR